MSQPPLTLVLGLQPYSTSPANSMFDSVHHRIILPKHPTAHTILPNAEGVHHQGSSKRKGPGGPTSDRCSVKIMKDPQAPAVRVTNSRRATPRAAPRPRPALPWRLLCPRSSSEGRAVSEGKVGKGTAYGCTAGPGWGEGLVGLGTVSVNSRGGQERPFLKATAQLLLMVGMVIKVMMTMWFAMYNWFPLNPFQVCSEHFAQIISLTTQNTCIA